jgi:hypothetical protein
LHCVLVAVEMGAREKMVINRSVSVAIRIQPTPAETHTFNSAAWECQLKLWISGKKRVFDNLW